METTASQQHGLASSSASPGTGDRDMSSGEGAEGALQQCLGAAHHSAVRQVELQKAEVPDSYQEDLSQRRLPELHVNTFSQQAEKPLLPSQMPLQ